MKNQRLSYFGVPYDQGLQNYSYEVEDGHLAAIEVYNEQDLIVSVELFSNMHEA